MSTYANAFSPLKKKFAIYPKRGAGTGEATASPEFRAFTTKKF